jgi:hypothetical protein
MPRRAKPKQTPLCIDDMTQEQVDEMIRRAIRTGAQISIDITPMVDRRLKADRRAKRL